MILEDDFYGGASYQSFGSDLAVHFKMGKVVNLSASAGSLSVKLPPIPSTAIPGAIYFVFINTGSNDVEITDSDGTSLSPQVDLAVDEAATVVLALSGTTKVWKCIIEDITGISPPVYTNFVYIGGSDGGVSDSKRIQGLDVFAYSWSQGTSSTGRHRSAGAFALSNRGFVFGDDADENMEEYVDDAWTAMATAPYHNTSTDVLNKGYVAGGAATAVGEYDRISDSWAVMGVPTSSYDIREWAGVGAYAYGTYGFPSDTGTHRYDPAADTWSTMTATAPTPARTAFESGAANSTDFFIACGFGGVGLADFDKYNVSGDSWSSLTDYPPGARTNASCVCANEDVYVSGGGGAITDCRKYDTSTSTWSSNYPMVYAPESSADSGFSIPP